MADTIAEPAAGGEELSENEVETDAEEEMEEEEEEEDMNAFATAFVGNDDDDARPIK